VYSYIQGIINGCEAPVHGIVIYNCSFSAKKTKIIVKMKKEQIFGDTDEHGLRMNSITKVFLILPVTGEQLYDCWLILNFLRNVP
jgi:hypothetical protein